MISGTRTKRWFSDHKIQGLGCHHYHCVLFFLIIVFIPRKCPSASWTDSFSSRWNRRYALKLEFSYYSRWLYPTSWSKLEVWIQSLDLQRFTVLRLFILLFRNLIKLTLYLLMARILNNCTLFRVFIFFYKIFYLNFSPLNCFNSH